MKKYLSFSILILALTACTQNHFVNVSMPNFKPQVPIKIKALDSKISIALEAVNVEQNNNYSDYFENSIVKMRLEKEIELLKDNLEEQIKTIAKLKGYKIDNLNPDYTLKSLINIYIEEKNVQKTKSFIKGDSIKSELNIRFKSKIDFINTHDTKNSTNLSNSTKLDSLIALNYPIKSNNGIFKTTISTVPTQLNKGLEKPAFEIDKSFLAFYKNTLNTLYNNLPKTTDLAKNPPKKSASFNHFDTSNVFEENP